MTAKFRASGARPVLLGVPFDAESSFARGAAAGPAAIRDAYHSPASSYWTESGIDLEKRIEDAGDVDCGGDPAQVRAAIETRVRAIVAAGGAPLALGGDHSITYPLVRGVAPPAGVTILHLDAHPDLYPDFEGNRFSHACPFARILEEGLATRLVQVGIRTLAGVQRETADRYGVEVIDMVSWVRGERPRIDGPVYLSLDLDALDPAHAPGVSHQEPGGLTTREVLTLLEDLRGPIIAADIVELNPSLDVNGATARVAAKFLKEIAGRMLE